jgi:hypothetical protein
MAADINYLRLRDEFVFGYPGRAIGVRILQYAGRIGLADG